MDNPFSRRRQSGSIFGKAGAVCANTFVNVFNTFHSIRISFKLHIIKSISWNTKGNVMRAGLRPFASANVNSMQGFTLVELLIVIILVGIMAVTALPALIGSRDVAASTFRAELLSLLRYQQQQAMQDTTRGCYGIAFMGTTVAPVECGSSIAAERVITVPENTTLQVSGSLLGLANGLRFNSQGCPVSTSHSAAAPEPCGQSMVELRLNGAQAAPICIQSQGFIRQGACN